MNFLEGLKIIWSDSEIRKTAIKSTVAAVTASGDRGHYVPVRIRAGLSGEGDNSEV